MARSIFCTCDAPSSSTLGDSRFRSPGPQPGLRLCADRHAYDAAPIMQNTIRAHRIVAGRRMDADCRDRASCRPARRAQCGLHFHFSFIDSHR